MKIIVVTCIVLGLTSAVAADPTFFVQPNTYPSTDNTLDQGWQADAGSFVELDLDEFGRGASIDTLIAGDVTIDVDVSGGENAEIFWGSYTGSAGGVYGTVYRGALLNRIPGTSIHQPQIIFSFSEPVKGFGTWVFDDGVGSTDSFRMIVTEVGGATYNSPILESNNGYPHFVEGWLGVTSSTGIIEVAVEILSSDPTSQWFELDHLQVAEDDEGPITSNVVAAPNPIATNSTVTLTANVDDSTTGGSNISGADYSLDSTNWYSMDAQDGAFDSVSEDVTTTFIAPVTAGIYNIAVHGTDVVPNVGDSELIMLVVYDPSGGFVTGGGRIDSPEGAYKPNPSLAGKANFGFVSKYKKGADVPTGNTEFQFKAGNLNFHSSSYDWLVVTGSNYARFKGSGTINGEGNYKFMLWAGDGETDTFRIRIWTEDEGGVETDVYDNGFDQAIGGGSIVVHTN